MLGLGQLIGLQNKKSGSREFVLDHPPIGLLVGHQDGRELIDRGKLLHRGHAVLRQRRDTGADLPVNAGGANHVEFVEVGGCYREETQAFEERMVLVACFFEDAAVELKPGQLAIVEAVRPLRDGLNLGFGATSAFHGCHSRGKLRNPVERSRL